MPVFRAQRFCTLVSAPHLSGSIPVSTQGEYARPRMRGLGIVESWKAGFEHQGLPHGEYLRQATEAKKLRADHRQGVAGEAGRLRRLRAEALTR